MSDSAGAAADDAQPTFRLIYRSRSLIGADERRAELGDIFTTARRKNRGLDVTGALVLSGDSFAQVLEGDEAVVRGLYATIREDPRHEDVAVLDEQTVDGRAFGRWAMARVATDGAADIRLMSNAQRGVIVAVPGADSTVTPDQEAVLTFMRKSIALETLET